MKVDMIHVGLHKTGTSWLQYEVFPRINKNIISNELFSGRPFRLTIDDIIDTNEREYYAKLLREKYGDVKILLGLRNPDTLIPSLYSQYLKGGGTMGYRLWRNIGFNPKYISYQRYVDFLRTIFSDVKIYHYEEIKDNKELFINELCEWLGCPVPKYRDYVINKGLSNWQKKKYWFKNNITQKKLDLKHLLN